MNPVDQQIADNIRAELARRRISQKRLAQAIGMNVKTLSDRLRGEASFTLPQLYAVAAALGIEPAALLPATRAAA